MMKTICGPPPLAHWLLIRMAREEERESVADDFAEIYSGIKADRGLRPARRWYWTQVVRSIPMFLKIQLSWSVAMFKNHLKITLRNIKRYKSFSFINIAGLAVGMACCLLILFWAQDELSFDRFHENADHLHRIIEDLNFEGNTQHIAMTPSALAPALLEEIPEVIDSAIFLPTPSLLVTHEEESFYENGVAFASPSFLEMFTFPFIKGGRGGASDDVSSVVITAHAAEKYFGREDPIGQTLTINNTHHFIVSGVIKNVPGNSHLKFDFLLPFTALENMTEDVGIRWRPVKNNWGINYFYTYIQVAEHTDIHALEEKITDFIREHSQITWVKLHVQPIKRIHLHSDLVADVENNGSIKHVHIFSLIAFFVLFIACINFMNLTTAYADKRAKEVGMRKISGAKKRQIIRQFLGESILLSFLSLFFAAGIALALLPAFSRLSGKELVLDTANSGVLFLIIMLITIATGILAGSYPAFFLSSFQPVKVLSALGKAGRRKTVFRRLLLFIQFSLSIFLIIATFVIHDQIHFIRSSPIGFDRDHVVSIRLRGDAAQYYPLVKNELLKNPHILGVTAANQLPTQIKYSFTGAHWEGKDPENNVLFNFITIDYDFIRTLNLHVLEGRDFSEAFQSDRSAAFILNKKAAEMIGKESLVGEAFSFFGRTGKIIGVVDDFHFDNFHNDIKPLVLLYEAPGSDNFLMAKISGDDISESLAGIEAAWNKSVPLYPFEWNFLDEEFHRQYQSEKRMGTLFNFFAFLSVFIASLGLFGLVSFIANQRTKEIGIRRVVGASIVDIVKILTKEFTLLVAVANIIAWPAAYYFMSRWLNHFAFRTQIRIWMFLVSAAIAFVIALLLVGFKTVRAATVNPVDSLRYE